MRQNRRGPRLSIHMVSAPLSFEALVPRILLLEEKKREKREKPDAFLDWIAIYGNLVTNQYSNNAMSLNESLHFLCNIKVKQCHKLLSRNCCSWKHPYFVFFKSCSNLHFILKIRLFELYALILFYILFEYKINSNYLIHYFQHIAKMYKATVTYFQHVMSYHENWKWIHYSCYEMLVHYTSLTGFQQG